MADATQTIPRSVSGSTPIFPTNNDNKSLAANVAETFTVPAGTTWCLISPTLGIWASVTGAAAIGTDISDGTGSIYLPGPSIFQIAAGASLSVICSNSCTMSVSWYKN